MLLERFLSLPTRERGLKSAPTLTLTPCALVAPYAGAWIEIHDEWWIISKRCVAPYAGAWIEILNEELNAALAVGRSLRGSVD